MKLVLNTKMVHMAMIERKMSKTALAKAMGIDTHTLTNYLNHPDKIQLRHVSSMVSALGIPFPKDFVTEVYDNEEEGLS